MKKEYFIFLFRCRYSVFHYLEIYFIPPLMRPFVLIADIDSDVIVVTIVVVRINKIAWPAISTALISRI